MYKIVVSNIVSLDGFVAGPDHDVMDLPMDEAFDAYNLERISAADTVLLGAESYRGFNSFWPDVQHHVPDPDDPVSARRYSADERALSRRFDEVDVVVVSDTLTVDPAAPWAPRTTVIPRDGVAGFKSSGDGEAVVFGSPTMWQAIIAQGLVDELHLMVAPVMLAGGRPVAREQVHGLRLSEVRRFDGSDNVVLIYAAERADDGGRVSVGR
jgi:dihydrofolate reductase